MKRLSLIVLCLFLLLLSACQRAPEPVLPPASEPIEQPAEVVTPSEIPEMPALPATDAELDALFKELASEGLQTNDSLERLKAEQPEFLVEYLMKQFRNGSLLGCSSGDGSVGTLQYSVWYQMLEGEMIPLEPESLQNYWDEWTGLADSLYEANGYDYFLEQGFWISALYLRLSRALPEAPDTAETAAYMGNGYYGFPITRTYVENEQLADVDGCGQEEQIQLLHLFDDHGQESYALRVMKKDQQWDSCSPIRYNPSIWISDLDEDGILEIFFNGDTASDDYSVYGWHLTDTGLQSLSDSKDGFLFTGQITNITAPMVDIRDYHHLLGSRFLSRSYTYDRTNGISVAFPWTGSKEAAPLVPIRDLPCRIDGKEAVVPAGTPLWLIQYDGDTQIILQTEDGTQAVLTYADQQINGVPESEYFENLIYAG